VQREIVSGTSVTVSYFRRDYKNLIWSDNLGIDPSDYTPVPIVSPTGETLTIYNLNPNKASALNLLDANSRPTTGSTPRRRQLQQPHEGTDAVRRHQPRPSDREHLPGRGSNQLALLRSGAARDPVLQTDQDLGSYALPWALQVSARSRAIRATRRNSTVDGTTALNNGTSSRGSVAADGVERGSDDLQDAHRQTLTQSSVNVPLNAPGTRFLERQNSSTYG